MRGKPNNLAIFLLSLLIIGMTSLAVVYTSEANASEGITITNDIPELKLPDFTQTRVDAISLNVNTPTESKEYRVPNPNNLTVNVISDTKTRYITLRDTVWINRLMPPLKMVGNDPKVTVPELIVSLD